MAHQFSGAGNGEASMSIAEGQRPSKFATPLLVALYVLTVLVATPRVLVEHSAVYQAIAHVYVGGLVGAFASGRRWHYLGMAIFLSLVEVGSFLYFGKR